MCRHASSMLRPPARLTKKRLQHRDSTATAPGRFQWKCTAIIRNAKQHTIPKPLATAGAHSQLQANHCNRRPQQRRRCVDIAAKHHRHLANQTRPSSPRRPPP